jgi:hypothetical protein
MKELKNDRDVLQALLDGETIQRTRRNGAEVLEWFLDSNGYIVYPSTAEVVPYYIRGIRIKPKTININGYEVPEPLREEPKHGTLVWGATWSNMCTLYTNEYRDFLSNGFLHLTEEAATTHRMALASFTTLKK